MHTYTKAILITLLLIASLFTLRYFVGGGTASKLSTDIQISEESFSVQNTKAHIGEDAPYFSLPSLSGGKTDLASLSGDGVILMFWSTRSAQASDQIKIFDDYISTHVQQIKDSGLRFIAISSQEQYTTVASVIRRGGYDVETLVDESGETSVSYGIQTLPTIFFINRSGKVVDIFVGTLSERAIVDKMEQVLRSD